MTTMQQPGAAERRAGAQFDRRDARLVLLALTIIAAAIGTVVVFTQSHGQQTTTAGITETLRFSGGPNPIAAGTDALWIGLNPALDREQQSGQPAPTQTQKFGLLERVNTNGAIERTLRIPGFVGPTMLHLGNALWVNHNGDPDRTGPGTLDERDWNTGKLLGRLAFDRGIFALTYGDQSLWVTVGHSPATLVRIDPATRRTIAPPIVVAPQWSYASAFGSGAVWATGGDGSLARVNPTTGHVDRVKLGGSNAGVIVSGGSVWVVVYDRSMVIRVDPRTLRVLHTTTVGNGPAYLAAAGGVIWVANQGDGTVTRIDARTGKTVGLPIRITPDNALTLAITGRSLWVTSLRPPAATRIDLNQAR